MKWFPHCEMVLAITKEDLLWAHIQRDISWSLAGFGRMNKFTLVLSVLFSVSDSKLEVAEWRWMAWRTPLSGRRSKNIFVVKSAKLAWHHFIKRYLWSLPVCLCLFRFFVFFRYVWSSFEIEKPPNTKINCWDILEVGQFCIWHQGSSFLRSLYPIF